jgi:hypothetical protein
MRPTITTRPSELPDRLIEELATFWRHYYDITRISSNPMVTHLAGAPEIASAVLQRQQAEAVIDVAPPHRFRRRRHGANGALPALGRKPSSRSTHSARHH